MCYDTSIISDGSDRSLINYNRSKRAYRQHLPSVLCLVIRDPFASVKENNNSKVTKARYPSLGGMDSGSLLRATVLRRNQTVSVG